MITGRGCYRTVWGLEANRSSGTLQVTAVTFNNVTATFTVNSVTQITATVPPGATTGPIAVTTPSGTASSVTNLTVLVGGPPPEGHRNLGSGPSPGPSSSSLDLLRLAATMGGSRLPTGARHQPNGARGKPWSRPRSQ